MDSPKNSLAVWALVLGILSLMCCSPAAIAAIVLGKKSQAATRNGEADNGSMGAAGVVLGWIGLAVWLAAIVYYFWLRSQTTGAEHFLQQLR